MNHFRYSPLMGQRLSRTKSTTTDAQGVPQPQAEPDGSPTLTQDIMQAALSTLKQVVSLVPVPYLQEAVKLASFFFEMVQTTSDNKSDFKTLIHEACELLVAVAHASEQLRTDHDGNVVPQGLADDLKVMVQSIKIMEESAQAHLSRSCIKRFFMNKSDAGKVRKLQRRLEAALSRFNLQALIGIRSDVAALIHEAAPSLDTALDNEHATHRPPLPMPTNFASSIGVVDPGPSAVPSINNGYIINTYTTNIFYMSSSSEDVSRLHKSDTAPQTGTQKEGCLSQCRCKAS